MHHNKIAIFVAKLQRMKRLNKFVMTVVDGIQEKKGKNIRVVDLSKIDDTICNYLVIGKER